MRHRLGNPEEHQADAHARREKHREPAEIAVIRSRCLAAEPDLAHWRHHEKQAEKHKNIGGTKEKPVECRGQERAQPTEEFCGRPLQHQRDEDKTDDGDTRDRKDRVMDIEAEWCDVVLSDFIVGLDRVRHRHALVVQVLAHRYSFQTRRKSPWRSVMKLAIQFIFYGIFVG